MATSRFHLLLIGMLLVAAGTPNALRAICEHGDRVALTLLAHASMPVAAAANGSCCASQGPAEASPEHAADSGLLALCFDSGHEHEHQGHTGFCCESQPCDADVSTDAVTRGDHEAEPDLALALNVLATLAAVDVRVEAEPTDDGGPADAHGPPTSVLLSTIVLLV